MYNLSDTSFLLPVKLVDKYRENNLFVTLSYLTSFLNVFILIGECDVTQKVPNVIKNFLTRNKNIKYFFLKEENSLFHRTKILNFLAKQATTPIIAIYDIDLIADKESYLINRNNISNGICEYTAIYEKIYIISQEASRNFLNHYNTSLLKAKGTMPPAPGAITWVLRNKFFEYGGENEYCIGWGHEDIERHERFLKLGIKAKIPAVGTMWHIEHPPQPFRVLTDKKNSEQRKLLENETPEQTKERINKTFYWLK